jgi:hypothetical protein
MYTHHLPSNNRCDPATTAWWWIEQKYREFRWRGDRFKCIIGVHISPFFQIFELRPSRDTRLDIPVPLIHLTIHPEARFYLMLLSICCTYHWPSCSCCGSWQQTRNSTTLRRRDIPCTIAPHHLVPCNIRAVITVCRPIAVATDEWWETT